MDGWMDGKGRSFGIDSWGGAGWGRHIDRTSRFFRSISKDKYLPNLLKKPAESVNGPIYPSMLKADVPSHVSFLYPSIYMDQITFTNPTSTNFSTSRFMFATLLPVLLLSHRNAASATFLHSPRTFPHPCTSLIRICSLPTM